jgi:hypothetical protein
MGKKEGPHMQITDYSWFQSEIAKVKWPTFHVLKHNVTVESLAELGHTEDTLPGDYLSFLLQFGEARLFRVLDSRGSYLTVESPKKLAAETTVPMLRVGGYWLDGDVYLIQEDCGIFKRYGRRPRKIADDFASWFRKSVARAKKLYSKAEWQMLQQSPNPFTPQEQRIAEAIAKYRFKLVGVAPNGDAIIEVHNGSKETLDCVEVGIMSKRLEGAVQLDVHEIKPGETKSITRECYKQQVPAEEITLFNLPTPTPEDRQVFEELRLLNGKTY